VLLEQLAGVRIIKHRKGFGRSELARPVGAAEAGAWLRDQIGAARLCAASASAVLNGGAAQPPGSNRQR
jgi:hypothetical protein